MPDVEPTLGNFQGTARCLAPIAGLAAWLDRTSSHARVRRWSRKIYRVGYRRPFKHMTHAGARFSIQNPGTTGAARVVLWDGKVVAETEPLREIRNSESGSAFILATGPSIKEQNLAALAGRRVIGVNGAMAKLRELGISPSHYVITDDDFAINRFELVRAAIESGAACFFACSVIAAVCERDKTLLRGSNIRLVEPVNQLFGVPRLPAQQFRAWAECHPDVVLPSRPNAQADRIGFSKDLALGLFTACTVAFAALQVAYYAGFRRMGILGMDLDYSGPTPRFYEQKGQTRPSQVAQQYEPVIKPCFEVLRDICAREPFEVFNLSPKTRLPHEIVPHLSFERAMEMLT